MVDWARAEFPTRTCRVARSAGQRHAAHGVAPDLGSASGIERREEWMMGSKPWFERRWRAGSRWQRPQAETPPATSDRGAGEGVAGGVAGRADLESLRREAVSLWWLAFLECGSRPRAEEVVYESVVALCRQAGSEGAGRAERWAVLVDSVTSALGRSGDHGFEPADRAPRAGVKGGTADLEALALTLGRYNGSEVAELTAMPLGEVRRRIRRGLAAVGDWAGLLGPDTDSGPPLAERAARPLVP